MPEVRIRAPFPAPGAVLTQLSGCVQATRGAVGGYRLAAGTAMPPLLLEDDEAVAVVVSLRRRPAGLSRAWRRRRCARSPSSSRYFLPALDAASTRSSHTP